MIDLGLLDPRKRIASLFLQPDCDMACRFCASERGFSVMSFSQAEELLRALRERSFENVVLGGGEPLRWPHGLQELTRLASSLGFFVQVCTNGIELPAQLSPTDGVDRYILPLEAAHAEVHDQLRVHGAGHHGIVLARIETLVRLGREFTISTVVTRENVNEIGPLAALLRGLRGEEARIHSWHLYQFLPHGRGGRVNANPLELSREEFLEACDVAQPSSLDFPVYRRDDMRRAASVEYFWLEGERLRIGSTRWPRGAPH